MICPITGETPPRRSVLSYFGSKAEMANEIIAEFGKPKMFFDVFGGGAAVTLAMPRVDHQVYNDLNADVVNLVFVLQSHRAPDLYERVARAVNCEDLQQHARDAVKVCRSLPLPVTPDAITDDHVAYAYWVLVRDWLAINGCAGTRDGNFTHAKRFNFNGGSYSTRWRSIAKSIPAWADRLMDVQVWTVDAFDLLDRIEDRDGVVIYLDPPYVHVTRGSGGGSKYRNDIPRGGLAEWKWHARLAKKARRFKRARVVISYYAHDGLDRLYSSARGWTRRDMSRPKPMSNVNGSERSVAPEVLYINGPSYVVPGENTLFGATA